MDMEMIAARAISFDGRKIRADYLRNFYELGRKNLDYLRTRAMIAYQIPAGRARDEAVAKMIVTLIDQAVKVFRLDRELHVVLSPRVLESESCPEKLGTYIIGGPLMRCVVPLGSYIVFLTQPPAALRCRRSFSSHRLSNRLTAQGEAERPYDVAGWTLPLQMGIDAPAIVAIREDANES